MKFIYKIDNKPKHILSHHISFSNATLGLHTQKPDTPSDVPWQVFQMKTDYASNIFMTQSTKVWLELQTVTKQ